MLGPEDMRHHWKHLANTDKHSWNEPQFYKWLLTFLFPTDTTNALLPPVASSLRGFPLLFSTTPFV